METKKENKTETQGVEVKKRTVTITLNGEQIKELGEDKELREEVLNQLKNSEGGLKGNMAIAIAKAVLRKTNMKL